MNCQNLFFRKQDLTIHANCLQVCKLSRVETICMNCQNLFSGEIKKNISVYISSAENFTQSAKR